MEHVDLVNYICLLNLSFKNIERRIFNYEVASDRYLDIWITPGAGNN